MGYCESCGEKLGEKVNFCAKCGGRVEAPKEKNKEKTEKKAEKGNQIVPILVCVIIAVVGIIVFQNMSGAVIGSPEPIKPIADSGPPNPDDGPKLACSDSDDGINFETPGIVNMLTSGNVLTYSDTCINNNTLRESFCSGSEYNSTAKTCEYGCSTNVNNIGFCRTPVATCSDSDGGSVFNVSGKASNSIGSNGKDFCIGSNILEEAVCNDLGEVKQIRIDCTEEGFSRCFEGICAYKCSDTDGGLNFNKVGIAIADSVDHTDICMIILPDMDKSEWLELGAGNSLKEYYCEKNEVATNVTKCNCKNGACVPESEGRTWRYASLNTGDSELIGGKTVTFVRITGNSALFEVGGEQNSVALSEVKKINGVSIYVDKIHDIAESPDDVVEIIAYA